MFNLKIEDIQDFLENKGHYWDGKLKDGTIVTDKNIDKILDKEVNLGGLLCGISYFHFYVFKGFGKNQHIAHDWTKDWIMHLIDVRSKEYVSDLKLWLRNQKSMIKADYAQEKNLLVRKLEKLEASHTQENNSLVAQLRELDQEKIAQLRELDAIEAYATND